MAKDNPSDETKCRCENVDEPMQCQNGDFRSGSFEEEIQQISHHLHLIWPGEPTANSPYPGHIQLLPLAKPRQSPCPIFP